MYGECGAASAPLPPQRRRVAVPARPVHPDRDRARARARERVSVIFVCSALGVIPTAALMGRATEQLAARSGPGHRRLPQRHLRQRARAHHRPLRAARGAAGGRQGLAGRLDPRQHPARHGRRDARRRPQARAPDVRPHGGQRAGADAAAGGRRAGHAGDLPARARAAACRGPTDEVEQLRRRRRAPLDRRRDRPAGHLPRRAGLLAQHPPRPLQPARRRPRSTRASRGPCARR